MIARLAEIRVSRDPICLEIRFDTPCTIPWAPQRAPQRVFGNGTSKPQEWNVKRDKNCENGKGNRKAIAGQVCRQAGRASSRARYRRQAASFSPSATRKRRGESATETRPTVSKKHRRRRENGKLLAAREGGRLWENRVGHGVARTHASNPAAGGCRVALCRPLRQSSWRPRAVVVESVVSLNRPSAPTHSSPNSFSLSLSFFLSFSFVPLSLFSPSFPSPPRHFSLPAPSYLLRAYSRAIRIAGEFAPRVSSLAEIRATNVRVPCAPPSPLCVDTARNFASDVRATRKVVQPRRVTNRGRSFSARASRRRPKYRRERSHRCNECSGTLRRRCCRCRLRAILPSPPCEGAPWWSHVALRQVDGLRYLESSDIESEYIRSQVESILRAALSEISLPARRMWGCRGWNANRFTLIEHATIAKSNSPFIAWSALCRWETRECKHVRII